MARATRTGKTYPHFVHLPLDPGLHADVKMIAEREHRSINAQLRVFIEDSTHAYLADAGLDPEPRREPESDPQ